MAGIDVEQASRDRGKHLVDLLADGMGQPPSADPVRIAHGEAPRSVYILGGASIALLFTAVITLILN